MNDLNDISRSFGDIWDSKILVVDDEEANARLLEYLLLRNGYRSVRWTTDPRDVVQIYQEFRPDLVLLDLNMPNMDGVEVMEKLQEVERETHPFIVVITANDDYEEKIRCLASGALDFLAKPFNRVEVAARIKNILNVRLLHNRVNHQNKILDQIIRERT
jgi:putative two-component system response regulator